MNDLDYAKKLSAQICEMFNDQNVPVHIGNGALAMLLGASAAHADDPDKYLKSIMELCQNMLAQRQEYLKNTATKH
jgi:hypothetical protein